MARIEGDVDDDDDGLAGADDGRALEHLVAPEIAEALEGEVDEHMTWRQNAPLLYDNFISCSLDWPALSVAWLPDEADEPPRFVIGTQTDGSASPELLLVEVAFNRAERLDIADPWQTWESDGLGELQGFGCTIVDKNTSPLSVVARWQHPTEVNRVAPSPHRPRLVATRAASGAVLLFDTRKVGSQAEVVLTCPDSMEDGFALSWSRQEKNIIASGGNDGRLCVWDVESPLSSGSTSAPIFSQIAHKGGGLCDLSFSSSSRSLLASVGDVDHELKLWDVRAAGNSQARVKASNDEVLSVDWSGKQEFILATTGKDKLVHLWDSRALNAPVQSLRGHQKQGVAVRWAPFRDAMLASCSDDGRVIIWDLDSKEHQPTGQPEEDDGDDSPELFFAHAGHTAGVSDFSWCDGEDFLFCCVGEDNSLQVWQPMSGFYQSESEGEDEGDGVGEVSRNGTKVVDAGPSNLAEPEAKRPKLGGTS